MPQTAVLRTVSVMAHRLGVSRRRVEYILNTRSHIRPVARSGNTRIFSADSEAQIRHELTAIDARRADNDDRQQDATAQS